MQRAAVPAAPALAWAGDLAAQPPVTVVICTRDRSESLARALGSLARLDYPDYRVLVVDSAPSDDRTRCAVAEASLSVPVDYLRVTEPGLSRARNAALAARPRALLAWLDDDEVAEPGWLRELVAALAQHPQAAVVCGAVAPAELVTPAQRWFEEFGGLVKGRGERQEVFSPATRRRQSPLYPLPPFGAGANMLTRPGVIESVGGFDPALGAGSLTGAGEDTLAFMLLLHRGATMVYQPSARLRHFHRGDYAQLRAQLVGYGSGLTAAYTALLLRSPLAVFELIRLAPRALRELYSSRGQRSAGLSPTFPAELLRANRRAMLAGPGRYLRARRAARGAQPRPEPLRGAQPRPEPLRGAQPRPEPLRGAQPRPEPLRGAQPSPELASWAQLGTERLDSAIPHPGARPLPRLRHAPRVSVVVATTFVRAEQLQRCLESLLAQDYPDFEVILVDNQPVPRPGLPVFGGRPAPGLVPAGVRVIAEPRPGASAARNAGIAAATGVVVAFTDDDAWAEPGWLRALATRLVLEPDAAGVVGPVAPAELVTKAQQWFEASGNSVGQRGVRASFASGRSRFTVTNRYAANASAQTSVYAFGQFGSGCNLAMRRDDLIELGGFDEALGPGTPTRAGEDLLLQLRALCSGRRLAVEPTALVQHSHRRDYRQLRGQLFGYGVGLTAMLTAAATGDRGHLVGLARLAPASLAFVLGRTPARRSVRAAGVPRRLRLVELVGMLIGPLAYLYSRWRSRKWRG